MSSKYRIIPLGGGGGITPTGTLDIRSEGVFDVTDYAAVDVDIFDDTTTKSITANGTYNAEDDHVLGYSQVNVAVEAVLQNKTVTPTTSQQTVEKDSGQGYDGLGTVTINGVTSAIDANIIASNIRDGVTILGVTGTYTGGAMIDPQDFLHFYNPNNSSATIGIGPYAPDSGAVLYYSTDPTVPTDQWTRWQFNDGNGDAITLGAGDTLYIYGDNPFGIPKIFGGYDARFMIVDDLECHGNIMSLLSIENKPIAPASAFIGLFANTNILTVPDLPATSVGEKAYCGMFQGCTGITSIPSGLLPATRLSGLCYEQMFYGCTGITSIPSGLLPATTLASSCYQFMFYSCTNLASVPSDILPATTLAEYCYDQMFAQTSITRSPDLPATTLASSCYSGMFNSCASLTTIGTISATVAASGCMSSMFMGCTSLTQAPALPATTLASSCYSNMFDGCTSLVSVNPNMLPATTLAEYCYSAMFNGCTSLTQAPALPATILADGCYYFMFDSCTSLNEISVSFSDSASQTWYSSFYFPYSDSWVTGVSQTGLFKKLGNANIPAGTSGIPQGWTVQTVDYFYIQNEDTQDLTFTLNTQNYNYRSTDLAWSKDMSTWTQFTKGVTKNQTVPLLQGEKLYLRSSTGFARGTYGDYSPITISCDGLFSAHGDLRTLIDYTNTASVTSLATGSFIRMFMNIRNITEIDCTLNGVTTIGSCAFMEFASDSANTDVNLTRVRISMPNVTTVTGTGTAAPFYRSFEYRSHLQEITLPNLQTWVDGAFNSWLYGVAATGTAYAPTGVTIPTGANGIPANWTRVNY